MANRRAFQYPRYQAWGSDETFLDGGTIEFFDAGTSNNRNVYQDAALTTTAPNPVTLNARGEPQSAGGTAIDIYLDEQPYKIVLKDSSGTTIHTIDNYVNPESLLVPQDPADAADQSTDVFEGTLSSDPSSGEVFVVDFQDANTTTTPTFENTDGSLGALTITTRDGSALWANALSGPHTLQIASDSGSWLVLDPIPQIPDSTDLLDEDDMASDSDAAVPTQQSVKAYADTKARIATGTYTGDGTTSQSITGVGFEPKYVHIWRRQTTPDGNVANVETIVEINDDHGDRGAVEHVGGGGHNFRTNQILSFDSDGFTVDDGGGDGNPNQDGVSYNYMAIG